MSVSFRTHVVKVASKREIRSTLYGIGIYVVLALIFIITAEFVVKSSIGNILSEGLIVRQNPITEAFTHSIRVAAAYLGLCAVLSLARDRDQGTLEVLFYGPVDAVSYLASKFVHLILAFVVVLAFTVANFVLVSLLTNLGLPSNLFSLMILSLFLTACMVSLGTFLSVLTRRMMVSVIVFSALALIVLAFSIAFSIVMKLPMMTTPADQLSPLLISVRVMIDNLNMVMQWISPMAYFDRGVTAILRGDYSRYATSIVSLIVYSGVFMSLSAWLFKKKGVRR